MTTRFSPFVYLFMIEFPHFSLRDLHDTIVALSIALKTFSLWWVTTKMCAARRSASKYMLANSGNNTFRSIKKCTGQIVGDVVFHTNQDR